MGTMKRILFFLSLWCSGLSLAVTEYYLYEDVKLECSRGPMCWLILNQETMVYYFPGLHEHLQSLLISAMKENLSIALDWQKIIQLKINFPWDEGKTGVFRLIPHKKPTYQMQGLIYTTVLPNNS